MDINTARIAVTIFSLIVFVGICAWAWSRRRATDFAEAAMLPFDGEEGDRPPPPR